MHTKTNRVIKTAEPQARAAATPAAVAELQEDRDYWREAVLKRHTEARHAQLRDGLLAWIGAVLQEIKAVADELDDNGSDLWGALTHDEKWELARTLDMIQTELEAAMPARKPSFLTPVVSMPFQAPGAEGRS